MFLENNSVINLFEKGILLNLKKYLTINWKWLSCVLLIVTDLAA